MQEREGEDGGVEGEAGGGGRERVIFIKTVVSGKSTTFQDKSPTDCTYFIFLREIT